MLHACRSACRDGGGWDHLLSLQVMLHDATYDECLRVVHETTSEYQTHFTYKILQTSTLIAVHCRPRIDIKFPKSLHDVARFEVVLDPRSRPGAKARVIVIPRKRLPNTAKHERLFAFVGKHGSMGEPH